MLKGKLGQYYAAAIVFLALILGGGTNQPLWTDQVIAAFLIPALIMGFWNFSEAKVSTLVKIGVLVLILLMTAQFFPLVREGVLPKSPQSDVAFDFLTVAPSRTVQSVLYLAPLLGFFLFVTCLEKPQHLFLLRIMIVGVVLNFFVAIVQLSYLGDQRSETMFPYEFSVGLMANENHFATLGFILIPLMAYYFTLSRQLSLLYFIAASAIIFVLFAVGSRAGMYLSLILTAICYLWFTLRPSTIRKLSYFLVPLLLIAVYLFSSEQLFLESQISPRLNIWSNSWNILTDNYLVGTGLGSFAYLYPFYEPNEKLYASFAYHVHNDYLEIWIEAGLVGVLLILSYLVFLLSNMFQSKLSQAAGLAILAILLHSIVDYPLRTYAIAIPFTVFSAVIFSSKRTDLRSEGHIKI